MLHSFKYIDNSILFIIISTILESEEMSKESSAKFNKQVMEALKTGNVPDFNQLLTRKEIFSEKFTDVSDQLSLAEMECSPSIVLLWKNGNGEGDH